MCMRAVDQEGIAEVIRAGPPLATYSIDRRCLRSYYAATKDGEIEAPICFFCACVYVRAGQCKSNDISWQQPTKRDGYFFSCTATETRQLFALKTYMENSTWKMKRIQISEVIVKSSIIGCLTGQREHRGIMLS